MDTIRVDHRPNSQDNRKMPADHWYLTGTLKGERQAGHGNGDMFVIEPFLRFNPRHALFVPEPRIVPPHDCAIMTHVIITPAGDKLHLRYCLKEAHTMPQSTEKVVLFATSNHNKRVVQRPVAAFNDIKQARTFATLLKLAYKSGVDEAVKAMDPGATRDEDGNLIENTKWSVVTVPYNPAASIPGEDDALEDGGVTS